MLETKIFNCNSCNKKNVTISIQLSKARSCEIKVINIFSNTCVSTYNIILHSLVVIGITFRTGLKLEPCNYMYAMA